MNGNYDRPGTPANNRQNRGSQSGSSSGGSQSQGGSSSSASVSSGNPNGANMNRLEQEILNHPEFRTPPQQTFDSEEMEGSIQKILSENIGAYVVVEFLIGTDRLTRKQGYLYHVGTSYITLYDDENENFILCDIFSVKFVYFYLPGQKPNRNFNMLPHSNGNSG